MNRPIEFRVWDGERMQKVETLDLIANAANESRMADDDFVFYGNNEKGVLMQFTGLLDKNGKEIYESDIVGDYFGQHEGKDVITKDSSRIVVWDDKKVGFNLDGDTSYLIVGNIHENPELLKEDSNS